MKILDVKTKKREIGTFGERAAARMLRKSGYRIRSRNFVAEGCEIDLVAENKEAIAFVEVKTRTVGHEDPREPRPASAVTPEKQRKIIRASHLFYSPTAKGKYRRFDVVEVLVTEEPRKVKEIRHLQNAFNRDTSNRR